MSQKKAKSDSLDNSLDSLSSSTIGKLANINYDELVFDHVYDCDNPSYNYAAFVQNVMTERFGVMCLQMENKDPEEIQFLTFSPKLYQYGQAEGFTKDESLEQWGDKILKNVKLNNFIEFIFSEETY